MKVIRKIINIDTEKCDNCGKCTGSCIEGALRMSEPAGKLYLVAEKFCDGCGACVKKCPCGALSIIEREADEYQELVYQRC